VHVPDAATTLVVRAAPGQRSGLTVVGPRTHASYYPGKDFPLCLKVRLRPGTARLLLGIPASQLVGQVISLGELRDTSGPPPSAPTGTAAAPQLVLKHLEQELLPRITARTTADLARSELARAAASELAGHPGRAPQPVRSVAQQLSVSERRPSTSSASHASAACSPTGRAAPPAGHISPSQPATTTSPT
jgi:hypothetical protein